MGGNALSVPTDRLNREEFTRLKWEVRKFLFNNVGYSTVYDIPFITSKETFGDLDLLLPKPKPEILSAKLINELGSKEVVSNKDIVSFEYKNFQVDLIHVPSNKLKIAQTYFAYNDLGMLMGYLAKRINCKYGWNGLFYEIYTTSKDKKWEIFLSDEPPEIFKILDLDYDRFMEGFESLEEIFEFVTNSCIFDTKSFLDQDQWNHRRRKRNQKRQTWQKFMEWLNTVPTIRGNLGAWSIPHYLTKFVPESYFYQEIEKILAKETISSEKQRKFNGDIVSSLTELTGKELGSFISQIKKSKEDFDDWVIKSSFHEIEKEILEKAEEYLHKPRQLVDE